MTAIAVAMPLTPTADDIVASMSLKSNFSLRSSKKPPSTVELSSVVAGSSATACMLIMHIAQMSAIIKSAATMSDTDLFNAFIFISLFVNSVDVPRFLHRVKPCNGFGASCVEVVELFFELLRFCFICGFCFRKRLFCLVQAR